MTDIRSRIAECVARAWFETQTTLGKMGMTWDHVPQELRDNSKTSLLPITDALLSLPGIAIVDIEADIEWIAERMADADDGIIYGLLTPDEAEFYRRMARAALTAAAQAREHQ